ncbi:MAG: type II toxin-antitoxin system VapC family toxin [Verrucomicrobiota bacterium]
MTGLDCNIVVQLALADHPANVRTVAAVQAEVQRNSRLVFPPLVVTEFLHVVTDGRRFVPPLGMREALDWIEEFLANPAVGLLEPTEQSLRQTLRWMRQFDLGRKRILDTHLAAVLHTAGARRLLTSNPADFTVFGVLETITP